MGILDFSTRYIRIVQFHPRTVPDIKKKKKNYPKKAKKPFMDKCISLTAMTGRNTNNSLKKTKEMGWDSFICPYPIK